MERLKVGIIGCGSIFSLHAAALVNLPYVELTAVCDSDESKAKRKASEFKCEYYTDYKELLNSKDIDAVHICLPHYLHAPVAIEAAYAKKHIICEKPMAIDFSDAEKMVKAAEDNKVMLNIIFQNRYNEASIFIKQALESGELGKIKSAKAYVNWNRGKEYYSRDAWRGTWAQEGGGVVINQAIHTLDLMRWFVNEEIDYIMANMENRVHPYIEVEDLAEGIVVFKSGIIASFYTMNYCSYDAPVEIEVHCEKGNVKMTGDRAVITFFDGQTRTADSNTNTFEQKQDNVKQCWGDSHLKQISNFYKTLLGEDQLFVPIDDIMKTQRMICDIYDSAREKCKKG